MRGAIREIVGRGEFRGFLDHFGEISHDGSMGRTVYVPTWMVDFCW